MAIVYVTTGAWGTGTGTPNSAAQVDGNFHDVDQRVVGLTADMAEGKRIDYVEYTTNSMTFHYTDGTFDVIPLPIATLTLVGVWMNSTTYLRGNLVIVNGLGIFQVNVDHITPPLPATFDANAEDGSGNRLYTLWMPIVDTVYDAMIFIPGTIQRADDELLFQGITDRALRLTNDSSTPRAYLDVGNDEAGATDIIVSIEKNEAEIGTITFTAGGDVDADGGQEGVFSIPTETDFVAGDRYALRITQSDNTQPSGLSVTLPFARMDI